MKDHMMIVRVTEEMFKKVQKKAEKEGRGVSEIIRQFMAQYAEEKDEK